MGTTNNCARHGCRKQALRRFCSDTCRIAHHNARRRPAPKVRITCQGCGSVFQGRPDQKTCSATCRSRLFRSRQLHTDMRSPDSGVTIADSNLSAPFSPAELRQKVQTKVNEPRTDYSWLPAQPRKVSVKKSSVKSGQLGFDFGSDA